VQRTVGIDDWFELSQRAEPKRSIGRRIVTDVLWVYPTAVVAGVFLAPRIAEWSLVTRALVSTGLVTVVMRLAVGPLRSRLRSRRTM